MRDRPIFTTDQIGYAEALRVLDSFVHVSKLHQETEARDKKIAELRAALTLLLEKYVQAEHMGGFSMEQIDGFPEVILARKVLAD
jgi:hypothetical protein